MSDSEVYREFQRIKGRDAIPLGPICWCCGDECSGDVLIPVTLDGQSAWVPICPTCSHVEEDRDG